MKIFVSKNGLSEVLQNKQRHKMKYQVKMQELENIDLGHQMIPTLLNEWKRNAQGMKNIKLEENIKMLQIFPAVHKY